MKTIAENRPKTIEKLGVNLYSYNYDIQEIDSKYQFERYLFDHFPTINEVINAVVISKYVNGEELAIQRKGIIDPQNNEFVAYYQNVEQIKAKIKTEYGERARLQEMLNSAQLVIDLIEQSNENSTMAE